MNTGFTTLSARVNIAIAVFAAGAGLVASPAHAFSSVSFHGRGVVDFIEPGPYGFPAIGTPVIIGGNVVLGRKYADNFTGTVNISDALVRAGKQAFSFNGIPRGYLATAYNFGSVSFQNGVVTNVNLYWDDDYYATYLQGGRFGAGYSYPTSSGYSGTWMLYAAVPEAATWTLLIAGFGATGAALRRARSRKPLVL